MTDIETSLRRSYADCEPHVPDADALLRRARRQGRALRRRRRAAVAVGAMAMVVTAVIGGKALDRSSAHQGAPAPTAKMPVAAGPELTVYRYTTATGPTRIVSFIDTRGRWCLGAEPLNATVGRTDSYQCVDAQMPAARSGFGRVATRTDAFGYDGINQWLQGVATTDVAEVKVVMADGSTRAAHLVHAASGVVFSVRVGWLVTPVFYQAFDAGGRLIEEVRVPQSLPGDPFVDWRPFADTPAPTG